MATFWLPILGFATRLDDTGEAFFQQVLLAGENLADFAIFFDDPPGADVQLFGNFFIPKNYSEATSAGKIKLIWMADDITPVGVVAWEFKYKAVADGESYVKPFEETLTITTPNPATWLTRAISTLPLSTDKVAIDDDVRFTLSRDDSADTAVAARARLKGAFFEYLDS